jgi:DNA polymerase IV
MAPWVLHIDLDQFIAAVEILRRPELQGLPIIVGGRGDPTERAVVSTASYEAREFGVGSGMPLKTAVRKCPQAVLLPVDAPAYEAASSQVMDTVRAMDGTILEVLGWDEAFVGVDTDDPEAFARRIQAEVLAATRLHLSVGIGDTKVRAKIATDFGKPQGVYRLTRDNWFEVMGYRPTTAIWGIGSRIQKRLSDLGIETVHDLAAADADRLTAAFGPAMGPHFGRLGRGVSSSRVDDTPWVPRAHGHETTFQQNLTEPDEIAGAIRVLAEAVVKDIRREGRPCMRVHLKVRFAPFFTTTRIRKLPEPTYDPAVIAATALALLEKLGDDRPIRLLGVRAEMTEPEGGYDRPSGAIGRDPRSAS